MATTGMISSSTFSFDDCFDLDMALTMPELNSDEDGGAADDCVSLSAEEERDHLLLLVSEMATVLEPVGECAVCMEGFQADVGSTGKRTVCGHVYHAHCITKWVSTRKSCPMCRSPITGRRRET